MDKRAEIAQKAARLGVDAALKIRDNKVISTKKGQFNFVTQADLASNKVIIDLITKEFPADLILSEETISQISDPLTSERLWVIDPLDGTTNFKNGRKYCAVSIGFVEKGIPTIGAAYNIFQKDLYFAQKGKGAFINNQPIRVSTRRHITEAVIATETGYREEVGRANLQTIMNLPKLPWLVAGGSAVLEYCEAAQGSIDLFIHRDLKPWDNAAGFIIIKEAGGVFWDLQGYDASFTADSVICGNSILAKQILKYV